MISIFHPVTFSLCVLLSGCGPKAEQPVLGPQAETVKLVLYYSDGDADWKTVGETILLSTGETIKVERNVIRPGASLIVKDWNREFYPVLAGPPQPGTVEIRLDRTSGVACLANKCSRLYAICPPESLLSEASKCKSFTLK